MTIKIKFSSGKEIELTKDEVEAWLAAIHCHVVKNEAGRVIPK